MRILQISSAKNFGGGEKHLIDLATGLTNRGHEIFAALRSENNWQTKLAFLPKENLFNLSLRNSIDIFSARRLAKFAVKKKIEIIHAHLARDYPLAALASYLSKIPLVLTRHLLFPLNSFHRVTVKQADKIIAVSKGVAESLLSNNVVSAKKVSVVHNGVDTNVFKQAAKDIKKREKMRRKIALNAKFLIGTIGELRQHKGQEDFIRAAAIVAQKHQDAKFLIVGADNSTNQNYRIYLENLVNKLNLKNQIIFTGWLEEMPTLYAALDIFVSAARSEPFGLVIAEAMASGTAIVAAKTVGAGEILEDNITGILTPVENPQAIADVIFELLEDENRRKSLGKIAQEKATAKFSLERMIAETEGIYKQL